MDRFFTPGAVPALAALFFFGSLVGGAVTLAFRLFFWSEDRIKKTAAQAVDLALQSERFEAFVEKVAAAAFTGRSEADNAFRRDLTSTVKAMQARADAQSASIVEAHRRIDVVLEKFLSTSCERARSAAAALGTAGAVRP
jgi:hypothetical protein